MNYPIKLPQSVNNILWDYIDDDGTDEQGYFRLLNVMASTHVAENREQLKRLVKELDDQLNPGGLLSSAEYDAQTSGERLGCHSRRRALTNFRAKARAFLAESDLGITS